MLDVIRGLVRPTISVTFSVGILVLASILIIKFGNVEMAKTVLTFLLAQGATIIGFWFASREAKNKNGSGGDDGS